MRGRAVVAGPGSGALVRGAYLGFCGLVLLLLILPIFVILPLSFSSAPYLQFPPPGFSLQWYREYFNRADWIDPTILSFQVALATAVVSTVLGTLAAFGVVRGQYPGRRLVQAFLVSPMIVPLIIVAVATYFVFAKLRLVGSVWGLILAHSVLAIPRVFLVVAAALRGLDTTIERAAMSLGANRTKTFLLITLPLISRAVAVGAILAFLTSFDEVVVAIFISGSTAITLPKRMWDGILLEYNPTITAASSLLISLTIVVLLIFGFFKPATKRVEESY